MSMLPPPTLPAASGSTYLCPYCRLEGDATGSSCPHCGAPVDVRARTSASGWERQPAIKDMARIQFGQSSCQISGKYVPAAEMRLGPGEGIYFGHHQLLWADTQVAISNQPLKGAWNRKMAGLDVVMLQAHGPGSIALADNTPGETIAVPLIPGRSVDVREHRFVFASLNVVYDWYQSSVWYTTRNGDETETHYPAGMFLDRFAAVDRPGLLMLHGHGNVFDRELAPGESILIHPGAFVWKDSAVSMTMHLERAASGGWFTRWQPATPWLRLTGPGRIAVSSKYERMESTGRITNTSWCTAVDWNYAQPGLARQRMAPAAMPPASTFDDARFEAALDAFAVEQGFTPGRDSNRQTAVAHEYVHPSGLRVICSVVDAAASTAAGGQAVDGFGFPATWKQTGPGTSVLSITKDGRVFNLAIESQMAPNDQYGWLGAFAVAGLPAV
jgi:uncharacterized protein (AIM24 family)